MNRINIAGRVENDPVRKEGHRNRALHLPARLRSRRLQGRPSLDRRRNLGHLAGICYQHLTNGQKVIVAGRLAQKQWADPTTAEKRYRQVVAAIDVDFVSPTIDKAGPRQASSSRS